MNEPLSPIFSALYRMERGDHNRYWPRMEPTACRWCGTNRDEHRRRYTPGPGTHTWEHPTDAQILYRMLRRRYDVRRWQR